MKFFVSAVLLFVGSTSFAYDPVPFKSLGVRTVDIANVLIANSKAVSEAMQFGNRIVDIGFMRLSADYSRYRVLFRQCKDGACVGGAYLHIDKKRDPRPNASKEPYFETHIVPIR